MSQSNTKSSLLFTELVDKLEAAENDIIQLLSTASSIHSCLQQLTHHSNHPDTNQQDLHSQIQSYYQLLEGLNERIREVIARAPPMGIPTSRSGQIEQVKRHLHHASTQDSELESTETDTISME